MFHKKKICLNVLLSLTIIAFLIIFYDSFSDHKKICNILTQVEDLSRLNKSDELYTNADWFKVLKQRWSNYYDTLEKYWLKMYFRSDEQGDNIYLRKYEHFPEYYRYSVMLLLMCFPFNFVCFRDLYCVRLHMLFSTNFH